MSRFVDAIIVYRILKKLTTPFDKTDAFRLGIIDAKGKILRKFTDLKNDEEKNAYTLLDRLVWRLKRIIERVPGNSRFLANFVAAYALIKENVDANTEPMDLEVQYFNKLKQDLSEETVLVENYFNNQSNIKSFALFLEDGAVANSVGGGFSGQATPNPNPSLAGKDLGLGKKKIFKRKAPNV